MFKFLITSWYILPQVYWTTKWFPFSHYLTTLQSSVGSPTVSLWKRQLEPRLSRGKVLCFGCSGEHFSKARDIWLPHGFWWPYHSGKKAVLWRIWRALELLPRKLQRGSCGGGQLHGMASLPQQFVLKEMGQYVHSRRCASHGVILTCEGLWWKYLLHVRLLEGSSVWLYLCHVWRVVHRP